MKIALAAPWSVCVYLPALGVILYKRSVINMKHGHGPLYRHGRLPLFLKLSLPFIIFCALAAFSMMPHTAASTQPAEPAHQNVHALAGDTCAAATVINPAALPFFDEATNTDTDTSETPEES